MAWQHGPSSEARLSRARNAPPLPICSSSELNVLRILHVCMRMVTLWCMVSTHLRLIYSVVLNICVFRCGMVMFASLSRKRTSPGHGRTRHGRRRGTGGRDTRARRERAPGARAQAAGRRAQGASLVAAGRAGRAPSALWLSSSRLHSARTAPPVVVCASSARPTLPAGTVERW